MVRSNCPPQPASLLAFSAFTASLALAPNLASCRLSGRGWANSPFDLSTLGDDCRLLTAIGGAGGSRPPPPFLPPFQHPLPQGDNIPALPTIPTPPPPLFFPAVLYALIEIT